MTVRFCSVPGLLSSSTTTTAVPSRSSPEFLLLLRLLSRTWQTPRKGPCSHHCSSWPLLAYWCAGTCKFLESSDLNTHTAYLPPQYGWGAEEKKGEKKTPQLIINVASSYVHAQTDDGSDDNSWLDYGSFCDCMTLHAHDQFHPQDNVTAKVCNDINGTTNDWPADKNSISFLKHVGLCTYLYLLTLLLSSIPAAYMYWPWHFFLSSVISTSTTPKQQLQPSPKAAEPLTKNISTSTSRERNAVPKAMVRAKVTIRLLQRKFLPRQTRPRSVKTTTTISSIRMLFVSVSRLFPMRRFMP